MVEALGIEIPPLLDDPLPRNGFAPWEPWPPRAAQHLFMQRFRELAHASRSSSAIPNALLRTRGKPSCDANLTVATDSRRRSETRLPSWTAEDYAKHKRADRLAAASEAFHVVGWSRTDMVKALGIEIHPLLDDPLPPNGFARWEPWPPRAAEHLFIERFHEFAYASGSSMSPSRTPCFGRVASHPATSI